jgi:putative flippase GtrA
VTTWARLARFHAVGAAGIGVHLTSVWLLTSWGLPVVPATAAAVLAALAHNFSWHRHWTWRDRPAASWLRGFAAFVAANGVVSMTGSLLIAGALVAWAGVAAVPANAAAIAVCGLINFVLSDRLVFAAASAEHPVARSPRSPL